MDNIRGNAEYERAKDFIKKFNDEADILRKSVFKDIHPKVYQACIDAAEFKASKLQKKVSIYETKILNHG